VLDDLLTAFGLVLVLEGTFLALFPGLVAVALGAVLVWLIRG
jgi:uncharacterized protein YjeT (DUF2065 family)